MSGELEFNVKLEVEQLKADVRKVQQEFSKLGNKAQAEGSRIDSMFKKIGGAIAGYFGGQQLLTLGKAILDTTAKFEKFGIVLENTLGSKELADSALAMVAEFAATTPFSLEELSDSFIRLTNQGLQPTREEMVKMGDLASSTGKGFTQLTEAILDAQTGEFERLKEFGIKATKEGDKLTFTFKGQKTQIDNTAKSIKEYIVGLGGLKGITGANAKIAQSLSGQISNLGDSWDQLLNSVGSSNKGVISSTLKDWTFQLNETTVAITKANDEQSSFTEKAKAWTTILSKLNPLLGVFQKFLKDTANGLFSILPGMDKVIGKFQNFFGLVKDSGPAGQQDAGLSAYKTQKRKEIVDYYNERKQFYTDKAKADEELAKKDQERREKQRIQYSDDLIKQQEELEKVSRDAGFDLIQAEIDGMDEGMFKLLKQNELNHAIKLAQIDDQAKERLAKIQELEKIEFMKSGGVEERFRPKTIELNNTDKDYFQALKNAEITSYNKTNNNLINENTKAQEEQLKKLIQEFENFQQKKLRVAEEYDKKIKELQENNTTGQFNDIIIQAEKEKQNALLEIDKEIASKEASFIVWSESLTSMGLKQLLSALKTANEALDKDNLSDTEKSVLRSEIAILKEKIELEQEREKQATSRGKKKENTDWKETLDIMNSVNQTLSQMISNFDGLDQAAKDALSAASNIAGGIISMISAIKALAVTGIKALEGVERASAVLMAVTAAVTVISTIVGLFKKNSEEEKARQEAIAEATRRKIELQNVYNQMLREQALLMKDAESIFGKDWIARATESMRIINEMGDESDRILNQTVNLGSMPGSSAVLTTTMRSLLFGLYPGIIDAAGNLNLEIAKSVLATQELSDGTRLVIEDLVSIEETAQEAREALRSYLEDTFGALGEDLMSSISEALRSGVDAWEQFGDAGSKVLEKLAAQIAYSIFFAEDFKNLEDQLTCNWHAMNAAAVGQEASFPAIWVRLPWSSPRMARHSMSRARMPARCWPLTCQAATCEQRITVPGPPTGLLYPDRCG